MQNMLANLRARREDDERGFTLIELMVVVLIIAILIAIAIPTFLGAKSRAQDKAAQSSLRNALTNAKGIYTDGDSYAGATTTALLAAEPSLTFVSAATPSTTAKEVSVNVVDATHIILVAKSSSGACYVMGDAANGPGTVFAKTTGTCSGDGVVTSGLVTSGAGAFAASPGTNTSTTNTWVAAF